MLTLVSDPYISQELIDDRRAKGIDIFDEVWEGVYVMAPAPNDEHQQLAGRFIRVLLESVEDSGLGKVRPAINLVNDPNNWQHNFRIPDAVVFLHGSKATCHDTFWSGSPDFVIEIVSPWDKTRDKLPFYEEIGTRELLIVDRDPWQLELLRLQNGKLVNVGISNVKNSVNVGSEVLPLSFRLVASENRPMIDVRHAEGEKTWLV